MLTVSNDYKTAVNADSRRWIPKIEVYFDGINQPPVIFNGDDIIDCTFLEEATAESDNPLGSVSANEVTISFNNSTRAFTPTNILSPYYGKLKPNVLVKPYLGLELPDTTYEYIPLGVFRTGDWGSPSGTVEATVTCFDKLYEIGDKEVPMLPVKQNTTIGELFVLLFNALGITSYTVDESLNQVISIGWLSKGKVRDALQSLAVAGNCNVMADRYGAIRVQSNLSAGSSVVTFTDSNQIFSAENPQKYLDTYSVVKVNYKLPYLKAKDTILRVENVSIPNGGVTLQYEFSSGPIANVEKVKINGVTSTISQVDYGAWDISIQISNAGSAENVTVEVTGQAVASITSAYTIQDDTAVAQFGIKEIPIDNDLIQSEVVAQAYATGLLSYVKDPLVNFTISCRGNPAVEVCDVITIQDDTDKIGTVDVIPIRINLNYDGALDCTIEARKKVV